MSEIGQNVREEMHMFFLPRFERTVSDRWEFYFSKFTLKRYKNSHAALPKTWSFAEKGVSEVKGKATDMRFSRSE